MLPYFKALRTTGERYQAYGTVARTPWAMKAAIGLLSDTVPIFGYNKRPYIILVSVIGSVAFGILGFAPIPARLAPLAAFLLLLTNLQVATVDLLCEGKYAEKMRADQESGSQLVSFVSVLYMIGAFLGSIVAGPIADNFNPRYIFAVCVPLAAQVIFPAASGWLPEERLPPGSLKSGMWKVRKNWDLVLLSLAMTVSAMALGCASLFGTGMVLSGVSVFVALIMCCLGAVWLPPGLKAANLYMFLSNMLFVSLPGALDYWFTAHPECVPDGPHFSFTYYVTCASIVGSVAGLIGIAAFERFLSSRSFRTAFWTTLVVKIAASSFDIFIVKRYNKRLGINDKFAFILGDAIISRAASALEYLPAAVLTSKLCPEGMEATVYALLASYQSLGSDVSRTFGVALIDWLGVKTTAPCDFTNLPRAILIARVLLPLLSFPLVFTLIPPSKMTDSNVAQGDDSDTGEEIEMSALALVSAEDEDNIGQVG